MNAVLIPPVCGGDFNVTAGAAKSPVDRIKGQMLNRAVPPADRYIPLQAGAVYMACRRHRSAHGYRSNGAQHVEGHVFRRKGNVRRARMHIIGTAAPNRAAADSHIQIRQGHDSVGIGKISGTAIRFYAVVRKAVCFRPAQGLYSAALEIAGRLYFRRNRPQYGKRHRRNLRQVDRRSLRLGSKITRIGMIGTSARKLASGSMGC